MHECVIQCTIKPSPGVGYELLGGLHLLVQLLLHLVCIHLQAARPESPPSGDDDEDDDDDDDEAS